MPTRYTIENAAIRLTDSAIAPTVDGAALLGLANWLARRTIHDDTNRIGGEHPGEDLPGPGIIKLVSGNGDMKE